MHCIWMEHLGIGIGVCEMLWWLHHVLESSCFQGDEDLLAFYGCLYQRLVCIACAKR